MLVLLKIDIITNFTIPPLLPFGKKHFLWVTVVSVWCLTVALIVSILCWMKSPCGVVWKLIMVIRTLPEVSRLFSNFYLKERIKKLKNWCIAVLCLRSLNPVELMVTIRCWLTLISTSVFRIEEKLLQKMMQLRLLITAVGSICVMQLLIPHSRKKVLIINVNISLHAIRTLWSYTWLPVVAVPCPSPLNFPVPNKVWSLCFRVLGRKKELCCWKVL